MSETERLLDAAQKGDGTEIARVLDADPSLLRAERGGVSAIRLAVYHGHPAAARLFIDRGARLDVFDASATGETIRLRELLREDRARANAVASDGFTPLGLASFFGHVDSARLLLESGAAPNLPARNAMRVAPIHSAVAGGHLEIVRLLLENGADVHARQEGGYTPLHGAAVEGSEEMIGLLLEHGADRTATTSSGQTAGDLAREKGKPKAAELLR